MSAHLYRVPNIPDECPVSTAYYVAAESPLDAYDKVRRLYENARPFFLGIGEVEGLYTAVQPSDIPVGYGHFRTTDSVAERKRLGGPKKDAAVEGA